jgi:hypothetical protein
VVAEPAWGGSALMGAFTEGVSSVSRVLSNE